MNQAGLIFGLSLLLIIAVDCEENSTVKHINITPVNIAQDGEEWARHAYSQQTTRLLKATTTRSTHAKSLSISPPPPPPPPPPPLPFYPRAPDAPPPSPATSSPPPKIFLVSRPSVVSKPPPLPPPPKTITRPPSPSPPSAAVDAQTLESPPSPQLSPAPNPRPAPRSPIINASPPPPPSGINQGSSSSKCWFFFSLNSSIPMPCANFSFASRGWLIGASFESKSCAMEGARIGAGFYQSTIQAQIVFRQTDPSTVSNLNYIGNLVSSTSKASDLFTSLRLTSCSKPATVEIRTTCISPLIQHQYPLILTNPLCWSPPPRPPISPSPTPPLSPLPVPFPSPLPNPPLNPPQSPPPRPSAQPPSTFPKLNDIRPQPPQVNAENGAPPSPQPPSSPPKPSPPPPRPPSPLPPWPPRPPPPSPPLPSPPIPPFPPPRPPRPPPPRPPSPPPPRPPRPPPPFPPPQPSTPRPRPTFRSSPPFPPPPTALAADAPHPPSALAADAPPSLPLLNLSGVAYDGYLKNCIVYVDLNGDEEYSVGEPAGVSMGKVGWSISVTSDQQGFNTFVLPSDQTENRNVELPSPSCYDADTFLTLPIPLAAPPNSNVISPLSTLLVFRPDGVTLSDMEIVVKAGFNIPYRYRIGLTDAYVSYGKNLPGSFNMVLAEQLVGSVVIQTSYLLASGTTIEKVSRTVFKSVALIAWTQYSIGFPVNNVRCFDLSLSFTT